MLTEQLKASKNFFEMGKLMDTYLIAKYLSKKHKDNTCVIANVSDIILKNKGQVSPVLLSLYAHMSLRNFERRFLDEVGVSPKLYAMIIRFNSALENKMLNPFKRWNDIAYENGYFDQAHLTREVKMFSFKTPEELFRKAPPPTEDYTTMVLENA